MADKIADKAQQVEKKVEKKVKAASSEKNFLIVKSINSKIDLL